MSQGGSTFCFFPLTELSVAVICFYDSFHLINLYDIVNIILNSFPVSILDFLLAIPANMVCCLALNQTSMNIFKPA